MRSFSIICRSEVGLFQNDRTTPCLLLPSDRLLSQLNHLTQGSRPGTHASPLEPLSPCKWGQQTRIATIGETFHGAPDCASETPRVTALAKDWRPVTARGNAAALPVQPDNAPSKGQNQPANPCQPRGNEYPLTTAGPLIQS
jgi:hypothetical protein